MGHGGEEVSFCITGNPGCLTGILQHLPLSRLLHALLGYVKAHAVIGGDAVPAVLGTDKAEGQCQYFESAMISDNTPFGCCGFSGHP